MTSTRILTAAAILIACGCTESSTGPRYTAIGDPPPPPEPVVVKGTIMVSSDAVLLQLESGEIVVLVGSEAERLATLDGDEVQLHGDWITGEPPLETDDSLDAIRPQFAVADFLVLAVAGRPAIDGLLIKEGGSYYLTLVSGDVLWLDDGPSVFESYVGKRIWVTGSMADPPLEFGVIE